ncbi:MULTISPECIES: DUF951 domain-containing protein [Facklamia]|uniref:DUF951 domain-containing protein n=2 Tax=Facklamia hominis TaxID=178214 RepID=K1LS21_9LACT|nr:MULTISPECIES: DUF951 domain-containing protein [Facklamia]EKB54927.1 hypothetical protein HMPREF9706_01117 [Facklamia hominis CCUG 36813]EPH07582.1 hypothetical protein HMPREF9260_01579 [Facklamia hominis ACS-120-V-Sch10]MDK7187398.1 DUF951 domain-containing protein [Facklamia hominis]OFL63812.1 hypothetical protein HMPREF2758_04315 [Facklamia sp. HMSC062C11]PKY93944.1 DUF951 domain-containing protein [Facklamia hominis]
MVNKEYDKFDIVQMKKPHACQSNAWQIIRMGMDIRIKCQKCEHIVTMTRREFERKLKKVLKKADTI